MIATSDPRCRYCGQHILDTHPQWCHMLSSRDQNIELLEAKVAKLEKLLGQKVLNMRVIKSAKKIKKQYSKELKYLEDK